MAVSNKTVPAESTNVAGGCLCVRSPLGSSSTNPIETRRCNGRFPERDCMGVTKAKAPGLCHHVTACLARASRETHSPWTCPAFKWELESGNMGVLHSTGRTHELDASQTPSAASLGPFSPPHSEVECFRRNTTVIHGWPLNPKPNPNFPRLSKPIFTTVMRVCPVFLSCLKSISRTLPVVRPT